MKGSIGSSTSLFYIPITHKRYSSCPYCANGKLLVRVNKKNEDKFLGCSRYPNCKYTCKSSDGYFDGTREYKIRGRNGKVVMKKKLSTTNSYKKIDYKK